MLTQASWCRNEAEMNRANKAEEFDTYEIEEPSDEERASSSEDELDVLLNGTPDQKRKLIREYLTGESESSSGDEFEKEMEAELSSTMRTMETTWAPPVEGEGSAPPGGGGEPGPLPAAQPMMYDQVYFDSDSDEDDKPCGSTGRRRSQRRIMTNDELLYDPDEDDRDQAWVDARRRQYIRSKPLCSGTRPAKLQALPSSDAVLNCPACMTTLCLDCQRHERYRTQYRAMFVLNCEVKTDEVLRYTSNGGGRRRGRGRKRRAGQMELGGAVTTEGEGDRVPERPMGLGTDELYQPVLCTECSTQVAVYDQHEVYHFFNILASHC